MSLLVFLVLYTFCVADRVSCQSNINNKACQALDRPRCYAWAINGLLSGTQLQRL